MQMTNWWISLLKVGCVASYMPCNHLLPRNVGFVFLCMGEVGNRKDVPLHALYHTDIGFADVCFFDNSVSYHM